MALLSASDFTGYNDTYAAPTGFNDAVFGGSVDLILSTGITQQVFDSLSSALKCIHYMEANNLYSLSPNEDVTILNLRSKLLVLENTYINQKMMNSYVFTYHGAQVRAIHRSMSDTVTLTDALSSVGFRCVSLPWSTASNKKWKLIVLIKIAQEFKSLMSTINHPHYPILIFLILPLLLFLLFKFESKE